MDLDVLLYGDLVCQQPHLKLPRPDLLKRAYMLGPLAELAPDLLHPTERQTIGELWQRFDRAAHPMVQVRGRLIYQPMLRPPSTARICPVTNGASWAKKSTARATSSADPMRLRAVRLMISSRSAVIDAIFRPHDRPRRDRVDSHLRPELPRQRLRQHDEAGFRDAVHRMAAHGAQCRECRRD